MSIEVYTGTPGSGKTFHAVKDMWDRLYFGHPVITNVDFQFPKKFRHSDAYLYCSIFDLTPKMLIAYSNQIKVSKGWVKVPEDYIYLVVDEAQLIFGCREWNRTDRKAWLEFYQQHRKYGYRVILITQIFKMLDTHIRGLAEYEIVHRKVSNFGIQGIFLSLLLLSPTMFVAVRVWSGLNIKVDSRMIRYSRRISRLYDTSVIVK